MSSPYCFDCAEAKAQHRSRRCHVKGCLNYSPPRKPGTFNVRPLKGIVGRW